MGAIDGSSVRVLTPEEDARYRAARFRALRTYPYLAGALVAMRPLAAPEFGTFAVDRSWRVYLDPVLLVKQRVGWVAAVLVHECSHLIRRHAARGVGVFGENPSSHQALVWNLACDAAINDDLAVANQPEEFDVSLEDGVQCEMLGLPRGGLEEEYYAALMLVTVSVLDPPRSRCGGGSAANGVPLSIELGAGAAADAFDDDAARVGPNPFRGFTSFEAANAERAARLEMKEWQLRDRGGMAAGHARFIDEGLDASLRWRELLRQRVRSAVRSASGWDATTWFRPTRRPQIGSFLKPATRGHLPIVAVIADTSGSVSKAELSQAFDEVRAVLDANRRGETRLYAADAGVYKVRLDGQRGPTVALGGGGTDMVVAIEHVRKVRPRPDVIIVLTDGFTRWPDREHARGVLAVIAPNGMDPPPHISSLRLPPTAGVRR